MEVIGQLHAPAILLPRKRPQSRSGHGGEEKNSQPLPRIDVSIFRPMNNNSWNSVFFVMWTCDRFS
jgi:hypothetical protein